MMSQAQAKLSPYKTQKLRAEKLEAENERLEKFEKRFNDVSKALNQVEKEKAAIEKTNQLLQSRIEGLKENLIKTNGIEKRFNEAEKELKRLKIIELKFQEAEKELKDKRSALKVIESSFSDSEQLLKKKDAELKSFQSKLTESGKDSILLKELQGRLNKKEEDFKAISYRNQKLENRLSLIESAQKAKTWLVKVFTSLEFVFCAMTFAIGFIALEITAPAMRGENLSYVGSIVGALAFDMAAMVSILYGRKYVSYIFIASTCVLLSVKFKAFYWSAASLVGVAISPKGLAITVAGSIALLVYSELFIKKMSLKI